MIGIVMVGHERIASEMQQALEHVVGEQPMVAAVDATADLSPDQLNELLRNRIRACDTGKGVLLLADMFGGTPCNVAMGCLSENVEVVSGFNLPLLIKAAILRKQIDKPGELAMRVVEAGRQYMSVAPRFEKDK